VPALLRNPLHFFIRPRHSFGYAFVLIHRSANFSLSHARPSHPPVLRVRAFGSFVWVFDSLRPFGFAWGRFSGFWFFVWGFDSLRPIGFAWGRVSGVWFFGSGV